MHKRHSPRPHQAGSSLSSHSADLAGLTRITIDAIIGVTEITESLHMTILRTTGKLGAPVHKPLASATAVIYRSIRSVTNLVGNGIDALLVKLAPLLGKNSPWPGREAVLAALNGVLGDYLAQMHNPLAIQMQMRRDGKPLLLTKQALKAAIPKVSGRILVLVHGLCMNDLEWRRRDHDHGASLAKERGYTTIYLHYNSGLHVSTNGRQFAAQLETLLAQWPVEVEELVILGHSMGGLVTRSALYYAKAVGQHWPDALRKIVFLGTPHHGAPLERGGNWFHVIANISSYTAPFSNLGKIRSAGITDLRYGNLLDDDWHGRDRFAHVGDHRQASLPLPDGVTCYTIAATTGKQAGDISDRLLGDGLVPLDSALGQHAQASLNLNFSKENQLVLVGMNHLDLLSRKEVHQQLLAWL
jgi:pimeloyl-ACP methyl ester carboxylesterase